MNKYELIATIVSAVGVVSFATIFTILYRSYATSAAAEYESGQADVELIEETILQNRHSSKRRAEVMRRVKKILSILLVAILIPLLGISLYTKITSGIAMVGGRGWIAVATPSMSMKNAANPYLANIDNQFDAYDMILLERVDSASDLQLYDVIAYVNDEGVNIIHRIVGIYPSTTGVRYITRGDANNVDDKYRPTVDDVLGRYTDRRIPYVGVFVLFLQSYAGIATILAVVYCLFMIEAVGTKIHAAREARLQLLHESIDFRTETEGEDALGSDFLETVYFKNIAYTFDKHGFVSKTVLPEPYVKDPPKKNTEHQAESPKKADPTADGEGNGDGEEL